MATRRADRALEVFLNETQADMLGLVHEDIDCPCSHMWRGDSALNLDPVSHSAHTELDRVVAHITGYDTFDDWLEHEVLIPKGTW